MGKNQEIKSIAKVIGNIAVHKVLINHTNKAESIPFISKEVNEYRANAIKKSILFNWNEKDISEIKKESLNYALKIREIKYQDVDMPLEELKGKISETLIEMGINYS